jgi:serine/threonine-protein kinase
VKSKLDARSSAPELHTSAHIETILANKYRILQKLAEGGTAKLDLAQPLSQSLTMPSLVIVKQLREHVADDAAVRVMFRDEMRLLKCLKHPSIVCCLDTQEDGSELFLVLEYVEGWDLETLLHCKLSSHSQNMPWQQAFTIAHGIAKGLVYLHNAQDAKGRPLGIIHRDISPSNVLISQRGEVKLTDFGVSIHQRMIRQTWGDDLRGKFGYIAPEMIEGNVADPRADIFSWGVIAWEMLAHRRLFDAPHPEAILNQICNSMIPPLSSIQADIPAEFTRIVECALQHNRAQRYQDSQSLLDELDRCQTIPYVKAMLHSQITLAQFLSQFIPSDYNSYG